MSRISTSGQWQTRAALLSAPGTPLSIETLDIGPLAPGDVLVKIVAASLCHTDLEVIDGQLPYQMPIVLGHEAAGRIVEVGSLVSRSRIGKPVILSWNPHCGHCDQCEAGRPILCADYLSEGPLGHQLDGKTRLSRNGADIGTMFFIAGFAEYAIVSSHCAVEIPEEMPLDRACLIGCAVMTGVGAAINVARIRLGMSVMVIGCGAVGLAAVQGARLAGAGRIIAVDPQVDRLALAARCGATATTTPDVALERTRDLTHGLGVDVVLESAGRANAFRLSAEACATGGQIVWLGKIGTGEEISFRWGALMGEKRIIRSSYGGARPQRDFPILARAYLDRKLLLDELVTQRIALEQINDGFDALRKGQAIRSVVTFDR